MPDTSKLEKLNRELEKSEKKLRKAINDEKALQHQLKQLTRKERRHRLCTRGDVYKRQFSHRKVSASSLSMTEWTAHRATMILPRCGISLTNGW